MERPAAKPGANYCRDRNQGRPLPALPPGHKQRQIRFPDAHGISTGDYVTIRTRNGKFTGYAMLYNQSRRITLAYHQPTVTGYISATKLNRRSHGYLRLN